MFSLMYGINKFRISQICMTNSVSASRTRTCIDTSKQRHHNLHKLPHSPHGERVVLGQLTYSIHNDSPKVLTCCCPRLNLMNTSICNCPVHSLLNKVIFHVINNNSALIIHASSTPPSRCRWKSCEYIYIYVSKN